MHAGVACWSRRAPHEGEPKCDGKATKRPKKNEGPTVLSKVGPRLLAKSKVIFTSGGCLCGQPAGRHQAVPPRWL